MRDELLGLVLLTITIITGGVIAYTLVALGWVD